MNKTIERHRPDMAADRALDDKIYATEERPQPFKVGDNVRTFKTALIEGEGKIVGFAHDDYPDSDDYFIVDFGEEGTCTVHKDEMELRLSDQGVMAEKQGYDMEVIRKLAKEKAETRVYVFMNRGDIEDACRDRGINVVKNRSSMEQKLIEALTGEYLGEVQE